MTTTLASLSRDLASGKTTSVALVRRALDKIADPAGEGTRTFIKVHASAAIAAAQAMDSLRGAGLAPSPLAGIPISVKDLFDLAGEPTAAGSKVLSAAAPARADAPAIARLRRAGLIVLGRTNMSEFAFSGVGLNPHFGTPASPYDRKARRIPGGSSAGAAVSVADGMAFAGIGSDTGGSCRIPAALCGIVGYKPTARAVPRCGVFPLSTSLDSIGPLAQSVACCRSLHEIMSADAVLPRPIHLKGMRIGVPQTVALDGLDATVAASFAKALSELSKAGALVIEVPFKCFAEVASMNAKGGFAASEAFAYHRDLLERCGDAYDPRVRARMLRGAQQTAADYIELLKARSAFMVEAEQDAAAFDVLAMPTTPIIAPRIADLEADDENFTRVNLMMLRNPTLINMMDGCSISLPINAAGQAPVGLMLSAPRGRDADLFDIAAAVEAAFRGES